MARYRVTISSANREFMLDLVRVHHVDVFDHGLRPPDNRGYAVDAIVDDAAITALAEAGYAVERHEDVDVAGRKAQREVGRGNRYKNPNTNTTSG